MNPKMQSILTPKSFKKQIEAHPDQFEKVENTGYEDREGREVMAQYVFHGQALTQTCKGCGGVLKPKEMRAEGQNGRTHIVNGLAKPVEVAAGWVRHALMMVWELLTLLFENDELSHPGKMKGKVRRPWERLDFYGENATLYRWRARAAQWFSRE